MTKKYIELNTFLNIKGIATSGGNAKHIIRNEEVKVNGNVETRNKRKLFASDVIEYDSETFEVLEEECKKTLE
ncbi:RNA-binding S4 domain-containing protein [Candidatus Woesearchaeota archaeon]|nr:RNA-binding S4 domain-containing protein [Candidatus Woesearchaeota archaeon]